MEILKLSKFITRSDRQKTDFRFGISIEEYISWKEKNDLFEYATKVNKKRM